MKKQLLIVLTLLSCVALSAQTVDVRVCQADKFLAGCATYDRTDGDQTGISVDLGEKSYTLNLHWGESATFAYTDSMAVGGKYLFGCQVLTEAGTYYDTLTTATGCDSIVTLTLTEYVPCSPVEFAYTDSVAVGGTYIFNCQVLTKAGTYTETLTKADGCDSVVTLTLTEYVPCSPVEFAYTDSVAVGGTYIFNCQVLTKAGTYTETLTKTDGCDSIVVLTLKEFTPVTIEQHDTLRKSLTANLCYGEAYVTRSETIYPTKDTTFSDTVVILRDTVITLAKTTIHTIDSIYIYDLTVNPTYNVSDNIVKCESELPFDWNGITIASASDNGKQVTLKTINECDSVVTLSLTINPTYNVSDPIVKCESELPFVWNGETIASASDNGKQVTLKTINECDSVVTLSLTINPTYNVSDNIVKCESELPFDWNGETIASASDNGKQVTLKTINECDSVVTLSLTVISAYTGITDGATICADELASFAWEGETFTMDELVKTKTLTSVGGCDSVVTFTLTVNSNYVDDLPALAKDDNWLLMVNRRSIREDYGISFTAEQVQWYRVEGEVDQYPNGESNDELIGTGDYYTIAKKLAGRYYAVLDGVDISAYGPCAKIARTVVLDCSQPKASGPRLSPSLVKYGQPITISNLDTDSESEITVYNTEGDMMHRLHVNGTDRFQINAEDGSGMYIMHVNNSSQSAVMKYIVKP